MLLLCPKKTGQKLQGFGAYLFTYLPKLNLKYLKYSLHNIHKVQVLLNIAMYVCDCALCLSFYADVFKTPLKNAKGMYFSTAVEKS